MILNVYAVYDSAAKAYMAPFYMHHDDMAIRIFTQAANNPDSAFYSFPGDYTLFSIATFDDSVGDFNVHPHKNLGMALHFQAKPREPDAEQEPLQPDTISGDTEE